MSTINVSKSSCQHSCDKCHSPGASNLLLEESNSSVRTNHITGNVYANTPSPSSTGSTSTTIRSPNSRSKSDYHPHVSLKRRSRHEKLPYYPNSVNGQYIITMTNILFQMQREIYRLKKRTHHVEQLLANQSQPIIRIPRLTKDEITTICIPDDEVPQNITSVVSEENNEVSATVTTNIESLHEHEESMDSSVPPHPTDEPQSSALPKYCMTCNLEFSHRSAYLRHMRRKHNTIYPRKSKKHDPAEADSTCSATPTLTSDQAEVEKESLPVTDKQWDFMEYALRPRSAPKLSSTPKNKVKCDICNKFFRIEYIQKHKRRTHAVQKPVAKRGRGRPRTRNLSATPKSVVDRQTPMNPSPTTSINSPPAVTIAELDVDELPIDFRRQSDRSLIIASTCLEQDQVDILEEFAQKFAPRVTLSAVVDADTTHLIANDDQHFRRSPLTMKLIEGIANHCFCVSYRWLIDCLRYDQIIEEDAYEIEGDDTDTHALGGPKRSRSAGRSHSLLDGICFMIKCTENNNIRMSNDRLQDLITTCGGQIIACVTQDFLDRFHIVVLCDKLYVSERRRNYDDCRRLDIKFVSPDWVLESILEYQQKPLISL